MGVVQKPAVLVCLTTGRDAGIRPEAESRGFLTGRRIRPAKAIRGGRAYNRGMSGESGATARIKLGAVNLDCRDAAEMAAFYGRLLGWEVG
jgi:hypothetical protein